MPVATATARLSVALLLFASVLAACTRRPTFQGTALDPPRDSLDFTLRDQHAQRLSLGNLRGKVVVLTFLYTSCDDVCPLVASKLGEAASLLGDRERDVTFLAITVDPERDTSARMAEYSRRWKAPPRWRFLTGPVSELEPVWRYYWAGVSRRAARGDAAPAAGAVAPAIGAAVTAAHHEVDHAAPVHLVDRAGHIRVVYGGAFRPAELAHDVEILLAE